MRRIEALELRDRQQQWELDEIFYRMQLDRDASATDVTDVLQGGAGDVSGSGGIFDSLLGWLSNPECINECGEFLDDEWDHRAKCPRGHFYWRCEDTERWQHFYCTSTPTHCWYCGGGGCTYCFGSGCGYGTCSECE